MEFSFNPVSVSLSNPSWDLKHGANAKPMLSSFNHGSQSTLKNEIYEMSDGQNSGNKIPIAKLLICNPLTVAYLPFQTNYLKESSIAIHTLPFSL